MLYTFFCIYTSYIVTENNGKAAKGLPKGAKAHHGEEAASSHSAAAFTGLECASL